MSIRILGVSGSMRAESHSARALRAALEAARGRGAETRLLDLSAADLPVYRPEDTPHTEGVVAAQDAVNWAEAFVLATPDYHGSMSGALKNFLDYFWEEFAGRLFAYLCASHEHGLTAMDQMRTAVRQCYGWSLPYGVTVHPKQDFDAAAGTYAQAVTRRLQMLARDLVVYGELLRDQYRRDLDGTEAATFAARYRKKSQV